jgi:hypothetical protein
MVTGSTGHSSDFVLFNSAVSWSWEELPLLFNMRSWSHSPFEVRIALRERLQQMAALRA